jgi:hypothetical protein
VVPLHALDRATGLLLHTGLHLDGVLSQALPLVDAGAVLAGSLASILFGGLLWGGLSLERARREGIPLATAFEAEAGVFGVVWLLPVGSALGLVSVGLHPVFPWASTLAVALGQDLYPGLLLVVAAGLAAQRWPRPFPGAPRTGEVFFLAFLAYALVSPEWARHWEGHPGNEPKTLRMALALGSRLSLNVEPETSLEEGADILGASAPRGYWTSARDALQTLLVESYGMAIALGNGREAWGAQAIRAERLARQTVRGKDGGIYHVLSPGPSLLLAPFLQVDRLIDRARGTPGRLAVTLLAWNALAAALVASLFVLARDLAEGRSALLVLVLGLFPPLVLFAFQFYPEVPGALLLTLAGQRLVRRAPWRDRDLVWLGLGLALLPWLHQKFLPVWLCLLALALVRAVSDLVTLRGLVGFLVPQVVSAYAFALFNFAITGSARPDALFLAWGPGGVSSSRVGEGIAGLLFDFRFGLLPVVPVYLLAAAGLVMGGRRLLVLAPPFLVYYLTVASADNWSGSVCNLGRYILPAVPLLALGVVLLGARIGARRGALFLVLVLFAVTGLLTGMLFHDPQAANDSARLFAKSACADFNLYIPNLFFRSWNYGEPVQALRLLACLAILALLTLVLLRERSLRRVGPTLWGSLAVVLLGSLVLERWPPTRIGPYYANRLRLGRSATAYLTGPFTIRDEQLFVGGGRLEILVSSGGTLGELLATAHGVGRFGEDGYLGTVLPEGSRRRVPLRLLAQVKGVGGTHETLLRQVLEVETPGELRLELRAP